MLTDPGTFAPYPYERERLDVRWMDARDLRFPDGSFDAVFSLSSIEHFGGPGRYRTGRRRDRTSGSARRSRFRGNGGLRATASTRLSARSRPDCAWRRSAAVLRPPLRVGECWMSSPRASFAAASSSHRGCGLCRNPICAYLRRPLRASLAGARPARSTVAPLISCSRPREPPGPRSAWPSKSPPASLAHLVSDKRALITGITGQDGSYLAELLLAKGYEVHGMVRRSSTETFQRLRAIRDEITLHTGDLLDQRSLVDVMRECEPTEIYNLAAMSFVPTSWNQPVLTGRVHRARASRGCSKRCGWSTRRRFYQASSSRDVRQGAEVPQTRDDAVLSPLALWRGQGLRPLHHGELPRKLRPVRVLGNPLQPRVAAAGAGVRHAQGDPRRGARSSSASQQELALGNLDAERDWGYAKDYVEAMWLMLQQDEPDDYVIATGETHSVRELVAIAFDQVGLDPGRPCPDRSEVSASGRGGAPHR